MNNLALKPEDRVLVLGATGFIGSRLVRALLRRNIRLRVMVRDPAKASALFPEGAELEIVTGDVLKNEGLREALRTIHSAYYLIHSMGGKSLLRNAEFARKDERAANNFNSAAEAEGLKRVIYLGGLGETGKDLSDHLKSRAEVAKILSHSKAAVTFLRAAIIIGAGGASFEMLRYLVERLPLMICPRWIDTRIQPISVDDALAYLVGCLLEPQTAGQKFDICGPDILTYRRMMHQFAEVRGLAKRLIISVPFLTPQLSSYWVDLVTPIQSGIAHPLIEGLKNEVICRESNIDEYVHIRKTPFKESLRKALSEEKSGPGVTGF